MLQLSYTETEMEVDHAALQAMGRSVMYISAVAGPRGNAPFRCFVVLISAEPRR